MAGLVNFLCNAYFARVKFGTTRARGIIVNYGLVFLILLKQLLNDDCLGYNFII